MRGLGRGIQRSPAGARKPGCCASSYGRESSHESCALPEHPFGKRHRHLATPVDTSHVLRPQCYAMPSFSAVGFSMLRGDMKAALPSLTYILPSSTAELQTQSSSLQSSDLTLIRGRKQSIGQTLELR